jgi:ATP-dependent Lhr-like helicase
VLYVCPLKALLNNLEPRLRAYAAWMGRRVAVWHGDITASARQRILRNPPDLLLTTPESLEAMLISIKVEQQPLFAGLRAIVVDELHSFAGDDRGWHLLAVLERLANVAGHPIQRVGLTATVGNPDPLLGWLQGSGRGRRPARVIAPAVAGADTASQVELDYVGSVDNAAAVIAALHQGEKRLVFCDSRQRVEELGAALRGLGITTFLSHASLAADERHRAEQAFQEARNCVIVATSTLELGVDVGDLDRVIQINSPMTVAAFLQRIGRTGRRPGSSRNCLVLALTEDELLWAAGLLQLWGQGFVEPVRPPADPRHIVAQQFLALCLQEHRVGDQLWRQAWNGLAPFDRSAEPIVRHLLEKGFVDRDGGFLFVGPTAERRFGHRHFMSMTAAFTAPPQFTVLAGRQEIGRTDPMLLTERIDGPRLILLGGRSWRVTWIDWKRRRCYVESADGGGRARWTTYAAAGAGFELTRAVRDVLIGADPPVAMTERATSSLRGSREQRLGEVHPGGTVVARAGDDVSWWTWAGYRANATLAATLSDLVDPAQRFDDTRIRLRSDLTWPMWRAGTGDAAERLCLPDVDERALVGLKFSEALPPRLATATLAARGADLDGASIVLAEPVRFSHADRR